MWRLAHAELIGEVQTVLHIGNDLPICREVQRGAWRWAEAQGWTVTRANGKEAIEAPDESRWLVRSQDGCYGWPAGLAVVDEAWDVKPTTVSEGLEPALLERLWSQLHLTSTAHTRATSLMRKRIAAALAADDGETLLLLWGARPQDDPGDPETWRAASPYWSEDRHRMIAAKYAAALAGEADPDVDDVDPLRGFVSQYLSVWLLRQPKAKRGNELVTADAWSTLEAEAPFALPDAAAIESWYADGASLALAWKSDGRAVVSVSNHATVAEAVEALRESGYRGMATIGASLRKDPALAGVRSRPGEGRVVAAAQMLQRLVSEDGIRHDGGEHLTEQVLAVRTLPGADGPRMVSAGRADAVKAAVWAAERCRTKTGKARVLLPSA